MGDRALSDEPSEQGRRPCVGHGWAERHPPLLPASVPGENCRAQLGPQDNTLAGEVDSVTLAQVTSASPHAHLLTVGRVLEAGHDGRQSEHGQDH